MTDTQYYSLLTSSGHQANIKAKALGLPIVISKVAFGSGNITPTESTTALVKEEIRVNINSIIQNETDKNILEIEAVIPSDVGGFLVNEAALYLEDGTLYAVANLPASYKPSLDQGAGKEFAFTIFLASVGVENVTLKIDDSIVFATRKYVQNELKKYAFKNGDKTQIFKVKDAVEDDEAVNKKQLDEITKKNTKTIDEALEKIDEAVSNIQVLPIGMIFPGYEDTNPNFIVAFGGTYKRIDYPKLWDWLQGKSWLKTENEWQIQLTANNGIVGFFSNGDGTTTFRVPSLNGTTAKFTNRGVGSYEADQVKSHRHTYDTPITEKTIGGGTNTVSNDVMTTGYTSYFGAAENTVRNTAFLPLIVAK